jgi:hypothetical protein
VTEGDGVTAEQETVSEPAAAVADERWRPSRRARIFALVLAVLLVGGITGGIVVIRHNESGPVDAVRAYVDAIARGDASAANAMVDPARFGKGVDPDLLTDDVLGSAKQRIRIEEVRVDPGTDFSADIVDVQVTYELGKFGATMLLRAQRAGTTLGVLDDFQVLDPLLVPVHLETDQPLLDTVELGDTATVPVGGWAPDGWPERPFFVYPGVYELRGHDSRYLTSTLDDLVAAHDGYDERPSRTEKPQSRSLVHYEATTELADAVSTRLARHLSACVAAVPKVPGDCPWVLDAYADFATGVKLEDRTVLESIETYQVEYRPDGKSKPPLGFTANGEFSYVNEEGERARQQFTAYGRIVVTPDDDLTVTFTQEF